MKNIYLAGIIVLAGLTSSAADLMKPLKVTMSHRYQDSASNKTMISLFSHRSGDNIYWAWSDTISTFTVSKTTLSLSFDLSPEDSKLSSKITLRNPAGTALLTQICANTCSVTLPSNTYTDSKLSFVMPASNNYTLDVTLKSGVLIKHSIVISDN